MKTIDIREAARLVAEGERMSVEERINLQQQRLRELVTYARENSPYLSKLYANVPEDFKLTDLPIVKKEDIVANYDNYVTDKRIHMQDVIDFIADHGCPEGNVTWSKEQFIHNKKGGKTPLFVNLCEA